MLPNLRVQRAHYGSLTYELFLPKNRQFTLTAYLQYLYDVAMDEDVASTFTYTVFNQLAELPSGQLMGVGIGTNAGIEASFQQRLQTDWYYLINASIFDSNFGNSISNRIGQSTRFAGRYLCNATVGKEWPTQQAGRFVGLNGRLNLYGGLRAQVVDLAASRSAGTTVFAGPSRFGDPRSYFRTDLRAYWKLNHPKRTTTLALDIQNVTNTENFAFAYYDSVLDAVVEKTQLGLIPNLTYRVEW